jgi:hypothetical protein
VDLVSMSPRILMAGVPRVGKSRTARASGWRYRVPAAKEGKIKGRGTVAA